MGSIEWTEATWNPVIGCSAVSAGCAHCWALSMARRQTRRPEYDGLVTPAGWAGRAKLVRSRLIEPLRWRAPRRIATCLMGDLFHETVPFDAIAAVFGVMAEASRHTFQLLTKRPARAREWFARIARETAGPHTPDPAFVIRTEAANHCVEEVDPGAGNPWPLPNVWLGTSIEDQRAADERLPELLATPAVVRWVSLEPMLGPVDLSPYLPHAFNREPHCPWCELCIPITPGMEWWKATREDRHGPFLNWIVVGGESGPSARPCDLAWIRSVVEQCAAAHVPCFVKQLGARPIVGPSGAPGETGWAESAGRGGEQADVRSRSNLTGMVGGLPGRECATWRCGPGEVRESEPRGVTACGICNRVGVW